MALILSIASGNFNNSATWSGGVVPGAADEARANSHTITITTSVTCSEISNAGTGTFILNGGVTLTANVTHKSTTTGINCLSFSSASPATATIIGNVSGGTANPSYAVANTSNGTLQITGAISGGGSGNCIAVYNSGSGTVIIIGNVISTNGNESYAVRNLSSGLIQVTGNVVGGSNAYGSAAIFNPAAGTINIIGNVTGGTASTQGAISNTSTGPVTVYGNLNGSTAAGLSNTSTGSVTVLGNVIGDSRGGSGIASSNAAANVKISGNLIGAPNGIPAVYAASYTVNPVPYQTYIRYANNGSGVGSDAYLYHYTTDSLSAFSMPPISAVRAGLQYADNTLTGTCQIPPVSSVTFGALVDNTSGTAVLTNNTLFDVSVASLTATDSLGARLKNSATVESVGRIIASF